MADPYVYPGTDVLINKEDIRDKDDLASFERTMTLQRMREGVPKVDLSAAGYRAIHRHLFQDIYDWAGQDRTVNIAKGGDMFCLVPHIANQMEQRFTLIQADKGKALVREEFATRAAEHICEINAIHPFREGNGRTQRAFLERLAVEAGQRIDLRQIDPKAWNQASIESFRKATYDAMRQVILATLVEPSREQAHSGKDSEQSDLSNGSRRSIERLASQRESGRLHKPTGRGGRGR